MIFHDNIPCGTNPAEAWPGDLPIAAQFVPRGETIGANFENALAALDQPGTEFYVPYATADMSCDAVAANMQLLNTFINTWNGRLSEAERQLFRSRETIENCKRIIYILTSKLGQYQVLKNVCDNPIVINPDPVNDGGENTDGNGSGASSGGSLLLPIGLGIAAVLFIRSRRKKNKKTS